MASEFANHYDYLNQHFMDFYQKVCEAEEVKPNGWVNEGIIVAHGDKCYGYKSQWEEAGLRFEHGVAIYLLTHCYPWGKEVRDTAKGWLAPDQWVIDNAPRLVKYLP